jgi:predicted metal-dependent phosphotriesterase family hydrolase
VIRTVLGDIEPGELGFCDAHDHVLISGGVGVVKTPDLDISDRDIATAELRSYRAGGGAAMVDCMPLDCGRDPVGLVEVSRATGVHIVASTGFHTPHYYTDDHWSYAYDEQRIADLLVAEVVDGMDRGSYGGPYVDRLDARAGVVKIASELGRIAPVTRKLIGAAATCHHETGVAIITHTEKGTMALEQVELLASLGVAAERIMLSHVDRNVDPGLHAELAQCGAYLIYDGPSRTQYHSVEQVIGLIQAAVDNGGSGRVLLGLDLALRSYRVGYGGSPGFGFLLDEFVPRLRAAGFRDELIDRFSVKNPAEALSLRARSVSAPSKEDDVHEPAAR